jgi:phosphoribosylaminoimidazole-succinocarboxamide synthase
MALRPTSPPTQAALVESHLPLPHARRGKVRDVYDLPQALLNPASTSSLTRTPQELLLIVASDRISAFDVVMPTPIPGKGRLLTQLSTFWLRFIEQRGITSTHLISTDIHDLADSLFTGQPPELYAGRISICRKTKVIPIECVVRGYLEGSGWKEYQASRSVCGVSLPSGLRQCDKLPEPIFTPATKEELGAHDQNISFATACELVGESTMRTLRETSLAIYNAASAHARQRGIIIADTKFEFGIPDGASQPILIDEALTPDSSRFWPAQTYAPGAPQLSFDKQYLREYLESLVRDGRWNKQSPGPAIPTDIVAATLDKYRQATTLLTS